MTGRQARFISHYLVSMNGAQSAIAAGYAARSARQTASRLLTNADIAAAVAAGKRRQFDKTELSAARVVEELRRIAFSDARDFFDAAGNLRPATTWTEEQASCLAELDVVVKAASADGGGADRVVKIRLVDKARALELLCRRLGLLTERTATAGGISVTWMPQDVSATPVPSADLPAVRQLTDGTRKPSR